MFRFYRYMLLTKVCWKKAKSTVEMVIQDENVNWLFNGAQELDNLGKTVIEFEYLEMECKCEMMIYL